MERNKLLRKLRARCIRYATLFASTMHIPSECQMYGVHILIQGTFKAFDDLHIWYSRGADKVHASEYIKQGNITSASQWGSLRGSGFIMWLTINFVLTSVRYTSIAFHLGVCLTDHVSLRTTAVRLNSSVVNIGGCFHRRDCHYDSSMTKVIFIREIPGRGTVAGFWRWSLVDDPGFN